MSVISEATAIRPFRIEVRDEELAELRRRLVATQGPSRELVADPSQGVQTATIEALTRYWANEHDWRRVEARLNALPQFKTEIDGLEIHFIHVKSPHENALPLHHTRLPRLGDRDAERHRPAHGSDSARRTRRGRVRRRSPGLASPTSRRRLAGINTARHTPEPS
jgi:hypothetical protein